MMIVNALLFFGIAVITLYTKGEPTNTFWAAITIANVYLAVHMGVKELKRERS